MFGRFWRLAHDDVEPLPPNVDWPQYLGWFSAPARDRVEDFP